MKKRSILVLICSALLFSALLVYSQAADKAKAPEEKTPTADTAKKTSDESAGNNQAGAPEVVEEIEELKEVEFNPHTAQLIEDETPTGKTADEDAGSNQAWSNQIGEEDIGEMKGASLYDTVKQGGPLMIVLIIFSIISLTLIIERVVFYTKNKIWDIKQLDMYMKNKAKQSKAKFREDMEDDLHKEFQLYSNRLEKGLGLLSGIGQLAPIVGFLGTVLGMVRAFASIAIATTVNAKVVAVGIQIALITTAGGLLIAAPTLTCFYFFMHFIQNRYSRSEEIIDDICKDMPKLSGKIK